MLGVALSKSTVTRQVWVRVTDNTLLTVLTDLESNTVYPLKLLVTVFCLQFQEIKSADGFKLYTFEFNDLELSDDETILASIRMMLELDFLNAVHTKQEVSVLRPHTVSLSKMVE